MSGTGVRLFRCKGWALHHHQDVDKAISIGGIGYLVLGVHLEVKAVGGFEGRDLSRPLAGQVDEWYCLERVRDGERRDIPVTQVRASLGAEELNAMEVLARVHRDRGEEASKDGQGSP